jgi:AAA ATPase domain
VSRKRAAYASASLLSADDQVAGIEAVLSSDLIGRLAVVGSFDPALAVPDEYHDALEHVTDRLLDRDGRAQFMLKERIRVDVMAELVRGDGRQGLAAQRGVVGAHDTTLDRILDRAISTGAIVINDLDDDELVAALHVGRWLTAAFSRGGRPGETPPGLERELIEGRLALLATTRPIREITAGGCLGRRTELERLHAHLRGPGGHLTLHEHPALLVYGVGGVGKSTLVAQFVLDVVDGPTPWAWVYLDLDRPSLSSYTTADVLGDIIRQVGAQFPKVRRYVDSVGSDSATSSVGNGVESFFDESWRDAIPRLASALTQVCDGRLVVVVDTYEELQRAEASLGDSRLGETLFRMFAVMSEQIGTFRLVVSGRAPADAFLASGRADQRLHVEALSGHPAIDLLQHLYHVEVERLGTAASRPDLDIQLATDVIATVGGTPLSLKLAAQVLAAQGYEAVADAVERSRVLGRVREEFVRGFLYNRVLEHIVGSRPEDREALREVARATLVLRLVTPQLITDVVAPAINRPNVDAQSLFESLRTETALAAGDNSALKLRDELRAPALLALQYDAPELVEAIHHRAAAYYEQHPNATGAAAERLYHTLALGLPVDWATLSTGIAREVERSVGDLATESRTILTSAIRSNQSVDATLAERTRERELESAALNHLRTGEADRAAQLVDDSERWSKTTTLHGVAATVYEQRGDLDRALDEATADLVAAELAGEPYRLCASAIRCALLQERVRGGRVGAATLTRIDADPALGGQVALRLELHLNRLAILERSGVDDQRWVLELDARALLQRIDPSVLQSSTALVRLLAATLGRDDAVLVTNAVDKLGLGETKYSTHVLQLADALAAWDSVGTDPGTVARSIGLSPASASADDLRQAWSQGIAALGHEARSLLGQAFALRPPSTEVLDALHTIFLWWGIDPSPTFDGPDAAAPEPESEHFLDGGIDYGDPGTAQLIRLLSGAYPEAADLEALAARAGLNMSQINVRQSSVLTVRDIVNDAGTDAKIVPLVNAVLHDPSIGAFADDIRAVIGSDWLARNGIT